MDFLKSQQRELSKTSRYANELRLVRSTANAAFASAHKLPRKRQRTRSNKELHKRLQEKDQNVASKRSGLLLRPPDL